MDGWLVCGPWSIRHFPHYTNTRTGMTLFILERKYGNDWYAAWFNFLELHGESPSHYFRSENPVELMFLVSVMRVDKQIAVELSHEVMRIPHIQRDVEFIVRQEDVNQ